MANEPMPVIGKDVIESLTLGMYEDSRFVFREYIQNSADQIDKGVLVGLLSKDQGEIHINIDTEGRSITIDDNATGIPEKDVIPILKNIAQSTKERGVHKGFRGIGRLGGLAYCSRLIFETSYAGEPVRSILSWDASMLKRIINDRSEKEDAASVISKVTSFKSEKEEVGKHYFRVIMEGVSADELLNVGDVHDYLSMVAPLPFPTRFIFKSKIYEEAKVMGVSIDEYRIFLNTDQVFKGYSTYIKKDESQSPYDQVIDLVFFKSFAKDGKLLYWGWHSLSEKNQSLNQVNYMRGFRLRKSNIQVGDEYSLLKLHRDRRFHFYFFGEVYGVHPGLIPNSRRDYFIENDIEQEFENSLRGYFHVDVYRLCYMASEINSSVKKLQELREFEKVFQEKSALGFTDRSEHQEYKERFERKKEEALKAKSKIEKLERDDSGAEPIKKILKRVVQPGKTSEVDLVMLPLDNAKPKFRTDNLTSLSKEERKFLSRIFTIIRNVLDKQTAENVIQKIEEEIR
ncbi:ATP-binding protein [Flaviaesturariibacter amylovorans]|uniref:Molecular chaperone HtpG n=1 Tax=Flaviaesturariibacter amylovorans TaxID=1084520 RepID=A0ABP8HIB7_9BACT